MRYVSKAKASFIAKDGQVLTLWQTSDSNYECQGIAVNGAQGS